MAAMRMLASAAAGAGATLVFADAFPGAVPSLGLSKPKEVSLQYFDIPGAAEKVRFALLMGKVPFRDDRVPFDKWAEVKPTTPFGQLPVMEVDGVRFAQSDAQLNYVGAVTGLIPKDPLKAAKVHEALGVVEDLRGKIRPSVYVGMDKSLSDRAKKAKVAVMRKELRETHIPAYLAHFEKMLERNEYVAGPAPTVADAYLLATTRWLAGGVLDGIPKDCLDAFPKLTAHKEKMEKIPEIAEYLEKCAKK